MAGGCCCSVKRKDSAIIGFAAMNITIFGLLFLTCSIQLAVCRYGLVCPMFGAAVFFCLVGITAGVLLLFAVTSKSKLMFVTWIVLESICLVAIFGMMCFLVPNAAYAFYPLIFFWCTFPFLVWSAVAVIMSFNGIVSGTVEDGQQGQMYGQIYNQPPSNQQMLPPNQMGGYPTQPQYGNNTVWPQPQLYQMPPPPGP